MCGGDEWRLIDVTRQALVRAHKPRREGAQVKAAEKPRKLAKEKAQATLKERRAGKLRRRRASHPNR
jgi:hypothetical protein